MKSRQPLKEIPFEDNFNTPNTQQQRQLHKNTKIPNNYLEINTTIPPIPPKRKPSEHSIKYIPSSASLKSNSIENIQNDSISQRPSTNFSTNSSVSTPTTKIAPNLSWLDRNRLDPLADVIHSLEFYQSYNSPTFTAKFPINSSPILEFPNNAKDPLTFCVDQSSTNRVNPIKMLPKIRQQNWLELELDIVLTLRLDSQEMVKSSFIHPNSENEAGTQEENICSVHSGFHWFLLHTDSDQSIEETLEKWSNSLNENKSFTMPNLYPIHPTPIENKPNLFKWTWNWNHLTNPSCLFVGHKNLCTLIKIPINAPYKVLPIVSFTFWTEAAPTRPRRRTLLDISSPRGKSASTSHILSESEYSESSNLKLINKSSDKSNDLKLASSNSQDLANESNKNLANEDEGARNEYTAHLNSLPGITPNPSPSLPSIDLLPHMPSSLDFVENEDLIIDNYSIVDGPVFRATILQLEKKIFSFKHDIKKIIKLGQEVMETRKAAMLAESEFHNALCTLPAIQPLKATYLQEASESITGYETHWMENFQSLILDPLNNLYDQDIKLAESKKKNFEQTSDDFYSFLNRYLAAKNKNNKQNLSEAKYNSRRRIFELSRFDYFNYLSELRGGGKDQDILNLFTIYSETQYTHFSNIHRSLFRLHDNLLELDKRITQSNHILMLQRKNRKKQRKDIDVSIPDIRDIEPNSNKSLNIFNNISSVSGGDSEKLDPNQKFKGIRDLQMSNRETTLAIGRKREGFLFTPSKTSSASNVLDKNLGINVSFHKKWCVLSGGYLHEYSNWKRQLESNNEPISLQFSTVRVASQLSRRFCFEIVTPRFKKIYQAMSEEDMLTWISCISNSIESLWNGTGSSDNIKFKEKSPNNKHKSGTPTIATQNSLGDDFLERSDNPELITLIERLRQIDPSNNICADCDSSNPDWCSINFGILLCIECSGLHRSLGTHITKIRSLILDVITFTPDLVSVIESIGNRRANIIWEACMDENKGYVESTGEKWVKPIISDDRGLKLKFVKAKYIDHKFVDQNLPPISDLTAYTNLINVPSVNYHATLSLYDACFKSDLISALRYIILGGVLNSFCNIDPYHEAYSLSNSGPISPLQLALFSQKQPSNDEGIKPKERLFTLPELLIQNGANINQLNPINQNTVLHHAARANDPSMIKYLLSKGADPALPLNNPSQWPGCLATDPLCNNILSEVTMGSNKSSPPKTNLVQFRASPIINGKSYISMPPSSSNKDVPSGASGLSVLSEGHAATNEKHLRFNAPYPPSSPHSRSYSLQPQLLYGSRHNRHSDPTDLAESPKYYITETGGVSQSSSSKSSPSDLKNSNNLKHNLKGFKNHINSFAQSHQIVQKTKDEENSAKPGRSSVSHDRSSSSKIPIKPQTKFPRSKTQNNIHHHNTSSELDESSNLSTNNELSTSDISNSDQSQLALSHSLPASSLLTQLDEKLEQAGSGFKRPVLKLPTSLLGKIKKISK